MRGNDQKYVPDPRSRSPGLNQYSNMMQDFQSNNNGFTGGERMSYIPPDYGRMNSGGGMQFPSAPNYGQSSYDRGDYKQPAAYKAPTPQQYPMHDFRSNFDSNSVFVPQSKYLQEEMKKNSFGKDFNYAPPSSSKPAPMNQNYPSMAMPQPQPYEMKPEMPK